MRAILLVLGFLFGLFETLAVFSGPLLYLFVNPLSATNVGFVSSLTTLTAFLIEPVLVFGVMFYIGGRFDLRSEYAPAFLALLIGAFIGTIGSMLILAVILLAAKPSAEVLGFSTSVAVYGGVGSLRLALVAFAGLAFAYFSKGPGQREPIKTTAGEAHS